MLNTDEGLTETLYDGLESLASISSLTVDYKGYVYWSTMEDGLENGSVIKARVDAPSEDTITTVSQVLQSTGSLSFKKEFLVFAGVDALSTPS